MPGRGNGRGRGGRVNFKVSQRNDQKSVMDRLGRIATYPKSNDRQVAKKYKFVRGPTNLDSVASVPSEARVRHLAKRFLKSYYDIFDQPGRANLASQYSADAFFSYSATFPTPTYGRNLLEVREPEPRISLLLHNRTNIANALSTFSPTEHLVSFLNNDVPFYIVNPMSVFCMQIIVTGVFKDTSLSEAENPLKAFTRVFVIKQVNVDKDGEPLYEIFNDLFMVQFPTPEQIKRNHENLQIYKNVESHKARIAQDRPNSSGSGDNLVRRQTDLLQLIMAKTKMNEAGSRQLLQDCNWDEKKSIDTFNALFAQNQIPQHFFTP